MNDQIQSGSLYQVNIEKKELYGFVFLKKNVYGDGFVVNSNGISSNSIKTQIDGKIITCVGKFPITCGGVTGSKDVFLYENKLLTALNKESVKFCSIIE